jgi:hypothetical protein
VRTTLTLDDDVVTRLKTEMRKTGQPFKQVVNKFLRLGLNTYPNLKSAKPFVVKARPLGARPGLNYDDIGELLEQLEGPIHR